MSLLIARLRDRARSERGFSLVELLVVIAIGGVVLAVTTSGIITAFQSQRRQTAQLHSLNDVKRVYERMSREVRAANPLLFGSDTSVRVEIRRGDQRHTITYDHAGSELYRTEIIRNAVTGVEITPGCATAPDGGVCRRLVLTGLDNPPGAAAFRFIELDEETFERFELAASPADPPLDVRQVGLVVMDLRVLPAEASRPIELQNEVRLRNG